MSDNNNSLWVLKTVHEDDKASKTIDSYEDSLSEYYNYDNHVANSKQIKDGDLAILIDKKKILGFAKIANIVTSSGSKNVRRCPECPSTTIDVRTTKTPVFRCNKGHAFDTPLEEEKYVTKYKANFDCFIPIENLNSDLMLLRPYYCKGYNQNMSMQKLDIKALSLFESIEERLNKFLSLSPSQGYTCEEEKLYIFRGEDEREVALRAIKLRRGQQNFRTKLLERFNNTCVITGCQIVDILEAAHIMPYRGNNDNNISNGLILRADIHTLFDLNLIAIEPNTYKIHIDPKLKKEYSFLEGKTIAFTTNNRPSENALDAKWEQYSG